MHRHVGTRLVRFKRGKTHVPWSCTMCFSDLRPLTRRNVCWLMVVFPSYSRTGVLPFHTCSRPLHTMHVAFPSSVHARMEAQTLVVDGPLGCVVIDPAKYDRASTMALQLEHTAQGMRITVTSPIKHAMHSFLSLVRQASIGVTRGYLMHLVAVGVGYKMHIEDNMLVCKVGLSHTITCAIPPDIRVFVPKPTQLLVFGIDRQRVHQVAAQCRSIKPPEPYKGKGLRYQTEVIRRKEGKKK